LRHTDLQTDHHLIYSRVGPVVSKCSSVRASASLSIRARPNAWFLLAALTLVGCKSDFVLVTFQMPPGQVYTGIRVTKVVYGGSPESHDYPFAGNQMSVGERPHQLDVAVPSDGAPVDVTAQAYAEVFFVAEGGTTVKAGQDTVDLKLVPCLLQVDKNTGGSCVRHPGPVVDPGDGGGTDVDVTDGGQSETGTGDLGGEVGLDTNPNGCVAPQDPTTSPDSFETPADLPPGCIRYCQAMMRDSGCPGVYRTESRCLYACGTLVWSPAQTSTNNTLSCRTSWAERPSNSNTEQEAQCRKAAPISVGSSNEDICGDTCEAYCRTGVRICEAQFPPYITCVDRCFARQRSGALQPGGPKIYQILYCQIAWLEKAIFNRELCSWASPDNRCGGGDCRPSGL
jgi:hypothetical protein